MKNIDRKRMVYSFYVNDDSFDHPINKIHFSLLSRYINIFDEVIFCIVIDDVNRYDLIYKIENFIISIFHKHVVFKIYENTNYRESFVFYNEIATQMEKLDGLTFFGHNKGITDGDDIETIKMWVASMYYFNLEYELPFNDINGYMFYGAHKTDFVDSEKILFNKTILYQGSWYYCGTFFLGKISGS